MSNLHYHDNYNYNVTRPVKMDQVGTQNLTTFFKLVAT